MYRNYGTHVIFLSIYDSRKDIDLSKLWRHDGTMVFFFQSGTLSKRRKNDGNMVEECGKNVDTYGTYHVYIYIYR